MATDATSRQEGIRSITTAYKDAIKAIENHPPHVAKHFHDVWNAVRGPLKNAPWARSAYLTENETEVVHGLIFASAFMSAWYDLQGDKVKRDEIGQSGALMVAMVGLSHEDAFNELMEFEKLFRIDLKKIVGKKGLLSLLFGS
jgi:hypothetical protein